MAEEEKQHQGEREPHEHHHEEHAHEYGAEHVEAEHSEPQEKPADEPHEQPAETGPAVAATPRPNKLEAFIGSKKGRLTLAGVGAAVLVVGLLFGIPATRYGILGNFIKKDVTLNLIDSKTGKPVSDAQVDIPGQSAQSDNKGAVQFKGVPVGPQQVTVKKKYYKDLTQTVNVWVLKNAEPDKLSVEATGRQVPVKVFNKISGQPVEKAKVIAADSSTITDAKGEAVLIMPADKTALTGTVKADGYNDLAVTVTNTEQADDKNTFNVVPSGKVYFLSKRTGKISVWKSDLDGGNAREVVQGTGKEDEGGTVLLASRDWRYSILKARRDSDRAKLYIIDASNDKMSLVDEGNAEFALIGWADHNFVYQVQRSGISGSQDGQKAFKSFSAETSKVTTLDTLTAFYDYEYNSTLFGNELLFAKNWQTYIGGSPAGKKVGVYSIQADGSGKKTIAEADVAGPSGYMFFTIKPYAPKEAYILLNTFNGPTQKKYEYDEGKLTEKNVSDDEINKDYPTYLVSPSGKETFWSDSRDGKNTLFIGDDEGKNEKEIASLTDYKQYGWFSDDYLLVSKNNSELYILAKQYPGKVLKVTDYHRPNYDFNHYGGGYGGF